MRISFEGKSEIERFILLMNIGFMVALKEGIVTIQEIENYIYNPYSMEKLRSNGIGEDVVRLVSLGCELEDVLSLIPDKLTSSINDIENQSKELLRSLPKSDQPTKKWIDWIHFVSIINGSVDVKIRWPLSFSQLSSGEEIIIG